MNEIIKATGSLDSNVIVEGPSLNSSSLNFSGSVQTYEIDVCLNESGEVAPLFLA